MAKVAPPPAAKSRKGAPPPPVQTIGNLDKSEPNNLQPLNFKVPPDFKREFKSYAAQHDVSMSQLLQEAFQVLKAQRG
jgi:hypothetical protein